MNKIVRYVRRNLEEDNNSGFCMQIKEQRAGQISAAANAKLLLWMHFLDVWYSSRPNRTARLKNRFRQGHCMQDSTSQLEKRGQFHRESAPITDWVRKFDDESVRELMEHYRPLLYEIARRHWDRRYQRRIDPSDALQLTWSSIAQTSRRVGFQNRAHFAGFLTRTLAQHLVNIRRSLYAKKRSVAREVDVCETPSEPVLDLAYDDPAVLDTLIEKEFLAEVLQVILQLPRELQRLLRWRFRKGMTYSEIAIRIDRTEDDVRHLVDKCVNDVCRELRNRDRRRK
jgi:RNA polymerase sigma factor (sigma-70 family)